MRPFFALIVCTVGVCLLPACSGETPTPAPAHKVVGVRDISVGAVRRFQVKVAVPQHYSREAVERVAKAVVTELTQAQPVNAVSILFYGPGTSTAGVYDVAMVDWAPKGRWADADSVEAGDYSTFAFSVSYNAPAPAPPKHATLKLSGQTGLLGTPLPAGATLLARTPGDPAVGRDPSERYSIAASAAEIVAFFEEAMPAAGWAKDGSSTATALFFRKGTLMIGVLTNRDGKTFTLMGS